MSLGLLLRLSHQLILHLLQDLEGIVTPNGLCFERHHGGVAEINPTDYRLMINGLVDREMIFSLDDLKGFLKSINFIS